MNSEEIRSTIEQIKAQVKANPENKDKSDDEIDELILDSFFKSYTEGKMTKEDLLGLAEEMGYEPDEGFENDAGAPAQVENQGQSGESGSSAPGEGEGGEQVTKQELEETRTMKPGETTAEFKDKINEVKGEEGGATPPPASAAEADDDDEDEEAERKAASELWKLDLSKK